MLTFLISKLINAKHVSILTLTLFGVVILIVLLVVAPITPANATEPTPTPSATPALNPSGTYSNLLCQLERGLNCDMINTLDLAISGSKLRTNPINEARNAPTYTLISITFDREMNSDTITKDTFSVSQGSNQIAGRIDYISIGRMAIFYPDTPLEPNTTYTAMVTTNVQDLSGVPLQKELVWSFTTALDDEIHLDNGLLQPNASPPGSGMNIYFGDLHSHTGYSDGQYTPLDAFTMAKASGLHFYGVTEHGFMLDAGEWQDVLNQANAATIDGQFVALPGFEYTHAKGHINVFGSDTYIHRDDPNYDTLAEFYTWLVNHPTAIGQFNHPNSIMNNFNFDNFAFNAAADQKMVLQELTTADQFFLSLDSGWHLGTLKNRDTHKADWGCCPLMGLLAPSLTKDSILEALRSRRTFFVSPDDSNLAVVMQANGYWMGSAIPSNSTINFTITAYDPDPTGKSLYLTLYDNGFPVASTVLPSAVWYNWSPTISGALGHYYYVEAYYTDWFYAAYSSPIWVERPPVADANNAQFVTPGALVTLDGTQSWDPDGDVLAYQWSQYSGPGISLNGTNSAQPTFTAPLALTDLGFSLTVVDTGSLNDSDTTTVTVTDKPILSISKSGPITAELGSLITYTLTVTNNGINDAIGVVITDAVPFGAIYVNGGTLLPGNIVSWTIPSLVANGNAVQVTFAVTVPTNIINNDYRASCADCISAIGDVAIRTTSPIQYLPIIHKNN